MTHLTVAPMSHANSAPTPHSSYEAEDAQDRSIKHPVPSQQSAFQQVLCLACENFPEDFRGPTYFPHQKSGKRRHVWEASYKDLAASGNIIFLQTSAPAFWESGMSSLDLNHGGLPVSMPAVQSAPMGAGAHGTPVPSLEFSHSFVLIAKHRSLRAASCFGSFVALIWELLPSHRNIMDATAEGMQ